VIEDNTENNPPKQRDFGIQPLAKIMEDSKLTAHQLVEHSSNQLTHKMVARAVKGRWLTRNVKTKILSALNAALMSEYKLPDIFNYR
jgi:hypothetical protein